EVGEAFADALGTVGAVGDGEMLRKNREGVAQDGVVVAEQKAALLRRAVGVAKKALPLADRLRVGLGGGGGEPGGVELHLENEIVDFDLARAHGRKRREVVTQERPLPGLLV